jgi:beta-lactamase regulating signal transducer with metallopeptidase domain
MNGLLHASWLPAVGWALLHSLWEGTLVALAAALVLRGLRGASPRLRYAVAVFALLLMAVLPVRHLLSLRATASPVLLTQRPLAQAGPIFTQVTPAPTPALRTRMTARLERAMPWVVVVWLAGACLSLLRLAGGWAWLQRLRWAKAELAPDVLQSRLLELCRRAGLKRAVTLLTCDGLVGPSVVGVLRPAILVPAGWFLNLPPDQVEALLAHELAHVLRHDYAVNLLQSLLEVVLFYHPAVWWLSRRIRAERELACDTFAARLMGNPLPLAEALTTLERRGLGRTSLEPAPAAHGGSLMERITHLLLPPRRTSSAPAFGAMAVMALILASGLRVMAQTPDPTPSVAPVIPKRSILPSGAKVGNENAALYIHSRNAKDADGKDIPYTQLLDIKADQMALNQVWRDYEETIQERRPDMNFQVWDGRDERIPGPRINLDLTAATPSDVYAVLNRLAAKFGVDPYQPPSPAALKNFLVTIHFLKDGQVCFDLYARQVSKDYLDKLLMEAHKLANSPGTGTSGGKNACGFDRGSDTYPGPKVDAIFEGLTLQELEVRVRKLQAEAQ